MASHYELVIQATAIADALWKGPGDTAIRSEKGTFQTHCPAHDDETPSLSISVDQNIRFKCWSGCADEDIRAGVAAHGFPKILENTRAKGGVGIKVNKVTHEGRPPDEWFLSQPTFNQRVPDFIYYYRNERSQLAFLVARVDAHPPEVPRKIIRPVCSVRAKVGTEDFWSAQAYPAKRPLYNLPELVERLGAPILLVEGEKAADAAKELLPAFVVVTWSGGAEAYKHSDWAPLTGRDVTLWPDNDAPGFKAMRGIAMLIAKGKKAAKSIRMVLEDVDDTFPPGFDLGDPYEDTYTPLSYMLEHTATVDPDAVPDTALPADEEEVASRLQQHLEKYAVVSSGIEHFYVDLASRSPFRTDMIPYARYSKHTLEQREAEAFIELVPNRAVKRRRYIDVFIESPKKIWLDGYVYDPGSAAIILTQGHTKLLNLYCGFANPPKPCDPVRYQCFVDHIRASCETPEEAEYLLDWFAAKLQNPAVMIGTMVILSGREGCGKTLVCDIICKILGPHNAAKIPMRDLTLTHNSQYSNKLMLSIEEYNPGASKQQRDMREMVKNLVTSQSMQVNTKFLPVYENKAYHSVIATTNSRTPEDISFDNRRMSFIHFDNQNLKTNGARIEDDAYFAPLVELYKQPESLSGLCNYLMSRQVSLGRVMKPIKTSMTKAAQTFVESPVHGFLRTLADTGVLPDVDIDLPNDTNRFPIDQWPKQACVMPRRVLVQMLRAHVREFQRQTISREHAGKLLSKALGTACPRGIPDSYLPDKNQRWTMVGRNKDTSEIQDRAFCLPDIGELRFMVEKMAGEPLEWSTIDLSDNPSAEVVVDFPSKKPVDDGEQF